MLAVGVFFLKSSFVTNITFVKYKNDMSGEKPVET